MKHLVEMSEDDVRDIIARAANVDAADVTVTHHAEDADPRCFTPAHITVTINSDAAIVFRDGYR